MSLKTSNIQIVYTDGSCAPTNPGIGGWAFIALNYNNINWSVSGGGNLSTNNKMELKAVIECLYFISDKVYFCIYTDSMYVINCATGKWKRTKNIDLWKEYDIVSENKNIKFIWVKGHNGNIYNEIVDKLAKKETKIK